jgi:hypothetical protein
VAPSALKSCFDAQLIKLSKSAFVLFGRDRVMLIDLVDVRYVCRMPRNRRRKGTRAMDIRLCKGAKKLRLFEGFDGKFL